MIKVEMITYTGESVPSSIHNWVSIEYLAERESVDLVSHNVSLNSIKNCLLSELSFLLFQIAS